jgi:predicted CxxxxCH...CXXCH cytochrome family protein
VRQFSCAPVRCHGDGDGRAAKAYYTPV